MRMTRRLLGSTSPELAETHDTLSGRQSVVEGSADAGLHEFSRSRHRAEAGLRGEDSKVERRSIALSAPQPARCCSPKPPTSCAARRRAERTQGKRRAGPRPPRCDRSPGTSLVGATTATTTAKHGDDWRRQYERGCRRPRPVIGMSLGGMTRCASPRTIALVTSGMVDGDRRRPRQATLIAFVTGPESSTTLEPCRTIEHNPKRTESSLRRGVLHNARELDDGRWSWRLHPMRSETHAVQRLRRPKRRTCSGFRGRGTNWPDHVPVTCGAVRSPESSRCDVERFLPIREVVTHVSMARGTASR